MSKLYNIFSLTISGLLFFSLLMIFAQLFNVSFTSFHYGWNDIYLYNIIGFTVIQASTSSFIIILFSTFLAQAFHRNPNFPGRKLLLQIFGLVFIMPVIVIISGLISIHGSNGIINKVFTIFGINIGSYLYGFAGILTAHLIFNLPFATRLILKALDSIPNELWRIASQLGMRSRDIFWHIELPIIKHTILKAFALIFIMCFTSFSVILTLGNDLKYTTLEVAIYQALKIDFDLANAVILSLIQLIICGTFIYLVNSIAPITKLNMTEKAQFFRPDASNKKIKIIDFILIVFSLVMIISPLIAIVINGINGSSFSAINSNEFKNALFESFKIALPSGILALFFAACLITLSYNIRFKFNKPDLSNKLTSLTNIFLCIPPFIITTGIIIMFGDKFNIFDYSTPIVILINSLSLLPFISNTIYSSLNNITIEHRWLALSLGIRESKFFLYVIWPEIRRSVGFALAVAVTLCLGNLGVINLLGSDNLITLPLLLYQKLSSFQLEEASVIALCLLVISYITFWFLERVIGGEK